MDAGLSLQGRYTFEELIGKGAQGETWRAYDVVSGGKVVIKVFDFSGSDSWGGYERFENEARVLRGIDHDRIPDYIDQFEYSSGGKVLFCLVQEYIEGETIAELVATGKRMPLVEIELIAADLLDIVRYLQSVSPVVIHRDINPKNVIMSGDGGIYLVDFGGVQDILRTTGATIIGTPGYIPIEQYSGKATPRSDLYGFASTILFLLTHTNPSDLPTVRLKIDIAASCPGISASLVPVLESYLEPDERDRTLPVDRALSYLRGQTKPSIASVESDVPGPGAIGPGVAGAGVVESEAASVRHMSELPPVPSGSKMTYRSESTGKIVVIPAAGLRSRGLFILPFALFWNGFIAFWTFMSVTMGAPIVFSLFSLPFWAVGIGMIIKVFQSVFERVELRVEDGPAGVRKLRVTKTMGPVNRVTEAPVSDIGLPSVTSTATRNGRSVPAVTFEAGIKRLRIGEHLSEREKQWLVQFIGSHARG